VLKSSSFTRRFLRNNSPIESTTNSVKITLLKNNPSAFGIRIIFKGLTKKNNILVTLQWSLLKASSEIQLNAFYSLDSDPFKLALESRSSTHYFTSLNHTEYVLDIEIIRRSLLKDKKCS
jgi:hypothetical protein